MVAISANKKVGEKTPRKSGAKSASAEKLNEPIKHLKQLGEIQVQDKEDFSKYNPKDFVAPVLMSEKAFEQMSQNLAASLKTNKLPFGIVLFAFGHPYYAHNAYNLAVSLKSFNDGIHITLVKEDSAYGQLDIDQMRIFDNAIDCKEEWITGKNGTDYYKAKIHLDEITPYERTLYLDVDMVWNHRRSPSDVFADLDGLTFTTANRGRISTIDGELKSRWVSVSDLSKYHDLSYVYDVSSEFMYFEDTKVFEVAREVYEANEMPVGKFGKGLPDEVWIAIAIEKTNTRLHESPYMPTYWQPFYFNKFHNDEFMLNHLATSIGGAFVHPRIAKFYSHITQSHFDKMRIKRVPYPALSKAKIPLLERKTI